MKEIHTFDLRENKSETPSILRTASRAVALKENLLLLIYLKETQEYKFPGGGVESQEDPVSAMIRETKEEAGATITKIHSALGYIDQINPDKYDATKTFYMRSIYYLVDVAKEMSQLQLSGYETELGFEPKWVTLEEAISVNQNRINLGSKHHWTMRELWMLNYIKEHLEEIKKGSS